MITTTYAFYTANYGGSLSAIEFNKYLPKAQTYLDIYTNGKYNLASDDTVTDIMLNRLRLCTCECIDVLGTTDDGHLTPQVGVAESETVGPWTVKKSLSAGGAKTPAQAFLKVIQFYLSGTEFFCTWA